MADARFSVVSKLMQNYEAGAPIDYHDAITATGDGQGGLLFCSIGSDGHIYLFTPASNTPTGWQMLDLSQGMDDYAATLLAAEQDAQGAPMLAAVMQSRSTGEYAVFFMQDFAAATGASRWVFRGKQGGTQVTRLAAGHGKAGAVLIVITTQQGDQSSNFVINPDLTDQTWLWREVPSPVNSPRVMATAIGHNARLESLDAVQGLLYTLYQGADAGQTTLVITSLPDFSFYNHPLPLDFSPSAFDVTRGAQSDSELLVGATQLYHLSSQLQLSRDADAVRQGLEAATTQPLSVPIQQITAGVMDGGLLEAWFIGADGTLLRAYQSAPQQWLTPLPFQAQVGALAAWRSDDKRLHEIFTVDLDNRLRRYRQDPQTMLWKGLDVMVEALDTYQEVSTYVTQLQIIDQGGLPLANQPVSISASERTVLTINHNVYTVDADVVMCMTDALGNLTIVNKVEGLSTPILRVQADVLGSQLIDIDPAAELRATLAGLTLDQLQGAQMQTDEIGVTEPLLAGQSQDALHGSHQALQQLMSLGHPLAFQGGAQPQYFVAQGAGTPMLNQIAYGTLPADYRWGLDLTGASPVYTADNDQIEAVHLARMRVKPSLTSLPRRTVLDDVGHFFGDVWHAVAHGLVTVEHWVVQKVSDGIQLVISTASEVYQIVVKYAEQIWSVVEYVFTKIGAAFAQAVRWLGFIFAWKDILRTHAVIRTTLSHGLDRLVGELDYAEDRIHAVFSELKSRISGADLPGQLGSAVPSTLQGFATTSGNASPLSSPDANWALHYVTSGRLTQYGDASPATSGISLPQTIQQDADQLKGLFNAAVLDFIHAKISFGDFLGQLVVIFADAVIDTIEALTLSLVEAVKLAAEAARTLLEVTWKIPLLAPLYAKLTDGAPLKLIDLIALLAAIPATVLYKLATGEAPFSAAEADQLSQTPSLDELCAAIVALDPPSAAMVIPPTTLPAGARRVSYVFGFAVGSAWIIYGVTNGLAVAGSNNPILLAVADRVKLATGLLVNGLSFVPMALVLHYAQGNIPDGSEQDLPRLRYEMFITAFQVLFNVKDGLTTFERNAESIDMPMLLDIFETIFGSLNLIWATTLMIAETAQNDFNLNNALKLNQNICASFTQIMALPGDLAEDPDTKTAVSIMQISLGAVPGIITCIRTGLDIHSGEIETTR